MWPISFLWICGSPKFEGWIEWRVHDSTSLYGGEVHVIFTTPGIDRAKGGPAAALSSRLTYDPANPAAQVLHGSADYEEAPATPINDQQGIWVVGHEKSHVSSAVPTPVVEDFDLSDDLPGHVISTGSVVVVRPAEEDGGVLKNGRTW